MKKSKLFIANIVLGSVFGVLLCISILSMVTFHFAFEEVEREYESQAWDEYYEDILDSYAGNYDDGWDYGDDWSYDDGWDYGDEDYGSWDDSVYYELPSITGAGAELIGTSYQEQEALEGYQYYQVTMQVYNAGTDYMIVDYMDLVVRGEEDNDVYRYRAPFLELNDPFQYSNLELIPSCQTAAVSFVIEVKDTVEDVTIEIYTASEAEEYASYVLNLR